MSGSNNSISISSGKVTINGETIEVPKNSSVSVINGVLYVNGKKYNEGNLKDKQVINLTIIGDVNNIDCGGHVEVTGIVNGDIDCGGSVTIKGDYNG